jgi:hypothetical protein
MRGKKGGMIVVHMGVTWFFCGLAVFIIIGLTIWVTNKAYSKKWEEEEPENK